MRTQGVSLDLLPSTRCDEAFAWEIKAERRKPNTVKSTFGSFYEMIGFEWFSAHAEGFLKAIGRKPSGEGSSVLFHARTLRKPLDI
jgi:hypothetical protein